MPEQETPFKVITTSITTLTAIIAVAIGGWQLSNFGYQLSADRHQRTVERSLQVIQTYITNTYYVAATNDIRDKALKVDGHYDYRLAAADPIVKRRIFDVLNYLEMAATGVRQQVYDEDIIKDHFYRQIRKYVEAHIKGLNGTMDGSDWISAGQLSPEGTFPNLTWLYDRWHPKDDAPKFRNK
ncbi:MAG TPA: DUF4760 domain-containing protein [Prosthecobacter sp.]